jgi:DNA-directed RNA polymerase subunit M/transcription elongation factor TFIIS
MKCACCGGDMLPEKDIGDSIIYKCAECGLSDSRVKKKQEKRVDIGQEVTRD